MQQLTIAKLALEREIAIRLTRVAGGQARERVDTDGPLSYLRQSHWVDAFRAALMRHYARTTMVVTGRRPSRDTNVDDAAISDAHRERMADRAARHARHLYDGIEAIAASLDRPSMIKSGEGLGSWMLEKYRQIMARVRARMRSVAISETNGPAEEARLEQARKLAGNGRLLKRWRTVMDDRVRRSHQLTEGQERLVSEPFDVDGDAMMFPGDNQFGADLSNIINCRCTCVYFVRADDGTETELAETAQLTPVAPSRGVGRVDHPSLITTTVRLREGMIERVFLADMQEARVSIRGGILRVTRGGRRLAIARWKEPGLIGVGALTNLGVEPEGAGIGIEDLLLRSTTRR